MSLKSSLNALGNAIRGKTGKTALLTIDKMTDEVDNLGGGFTICEDDFNYFLQGGEEKMKIFDMVDFSKCTNATYFMNNAKLDKDGKPLVKVDLRGLKFGAGTKIDNGNYMFNGMTNCTELILPDNAEYNIRATNYMFGGFKGTKITNLEKMHDDTGSASSNDKRNMFRGCTNLVEADLSGFTARVCTANMWQNAFYQCGNLRKIWLPSTCININASSYTSGSMMNSSNADCVIFTDAPSLPSTWIGQWNYFSAAVQCEVRYGKTHEDYENY